MKKIKTFLDDKLGISLALNTLDLKRLRELPIFITNGFTFYEANLEGKVGIVAKPKNEVSPAQLAKIKSIIEGKLLLPVLFSFEKLFSYNATRLISKKVDFIVLNATIYLPSFGFILRKNSKTTPQQISKMTPIAQMILLSHLLDVNLDGVTIHEIAQIFEINYLEANRATSVLSSLGLVEFFGKRNKIVIFKFKGQNLWKKAARFLISPIDRTYFTDFMLKEKFFFTAGINALSTYSDINPEKKQTYAISKQNFKFIKKTVNRQFGENEIQVWKYNPTLISNKDVVDPLSLYLTLREDKDIRVKKEIEKLLSFIKEW